MKSRLERAKIKWEIIAAFDDEQAEQQPYSAHSYRYTFILTNNAFYPTWWRWWWRRKRHWHPAIDTLSVCVCVCARETKWADCVSTHGTKTWLEHTFCSKKKKGSDQKHWRKSWSSFFSLHLAKRFEWNAINFLLLQCSFLMLPFLLFASVSSQYAAMAQANKFCNVVFFFIRIFSSCFDGLSLKTVQKCYKYIIVKSRQFTRKCCRFRWRHDQQQNLRKMVRIKMLSKRVK